MHRSRKNLPAALTVALIITLSGPALAREAPAAGPTPQEAETELWEGILDTGSARLRLEVEITRGDEVTGRLRSLDQDNATFPLSELRADGEVFSFSIPALGAAFSAEYAEDGASVAGTFRQGGGEIPLTLTRSESRTSSAGLADAGRLVEAWIGELQMGVMTPVMQFRIVELDSGETVAFFDSVTEGRTGFPATWLNDGTRLEFDVASIELTYRGTLNEAGDEAEGTWSQGGRDVPLTLARSATEHDSEQVWENRPQRPVAPFSYEAEEVSFPNTVDDVTLAGTLTIPEGPERHPAVVLISGSGAQDRDETLAGHKPFLVLADHLSRRGIAVLRYDDRGTAGSTGDFGSATTEHFARDASAAVEFLRSHPRIAPDRIGLAGHSEGGLVAPMVVALRDDVAFAVLMAGTGVEGVTIIATQTEAMLRAVGTDEAEIELAGRINRAVLDAATSAEPGTDLATVLEPFIEEVVAGLPDSEREEVGPAIRQSIRNSLPRLQSPWMRFFLTYDPVPALRAMDCPVLVIIGSKDVQVLPDLNLPPMRQAFVDGGNGDFEIVEIEGLNHLFQTAGTGSPNEYAQIDETFAPAALDVIGDWILARVTGSPTRNSAQSANRMPRTTNRCCESAPDASARAPVSPTR